MLQSWHNFFFVAAEPGGSVSVDKPPFGLWLQAISAYFLGIDGYSMLLPQIAAGILAVIVVYHLVQRSFGMAAGLLAALTLAVTPVAVAVDRNNTIDSTLILILLLATWAFIKATEKGKLRYFLVGTILVGIGFNTKMLAAYLPLPVFYALYFLGSTERIWRKLVNVGLGIMILLVVSLAWAVAVDLTPTNQRPYVGSSGDNSVLNLAIGYNGVERLLGMGGGRGRNQPGLLPFPSNPAGRQRPPGNRFPQMPESGTNVPPWQPAVNRAYPPPRPNNILQGWGQGPARGFGGGMDIGRAGTLRLFILPLSNQISWLLPFGLFSLCLLICLARPHWPITEKHQAAVVWGGWLLTGAVFFSIAGFFHPYYLSVIAAPLAALVGIGIVELRRLHQQRPWLAVVLLMTAATLTLGQQIVTVRAFVGAVWWLQVVAGLFLIGSALLIMGTSRRLHLHYGALAGFTSIIVAILLIPAFWSALTTLNPSENQSLPSAYSGRSSSPMNGGGIQISQDLLDYLEQQTQGTPYLMAVPSSMQGADYVLATGRPVLYMGGFMGQDKVLSSKDLANLVANGKLRFIYWNTRGGGFGSQTDISTWVTTQCKTVTGFDTITRNFGAPGGILTGSSEVTLYDRSFGVRSFPGGGDMQVSLYDCKG
jgi:4-amino-4-deoxy-L-arabinose transferase-like glycosyltransferase